MDENETQDKKPETGGRVETTARGGVVTETTYDEAGNVVEEITWLKGKPEGGRQSGDPRTGGPMANQEKRPL